MSERPNDSPPPRIMGPTGTGVAKDMAIAGAVFTILQYVMIATRAAIGPDQFPWPPLMDPPLLNAIAVVVSAYISTRRRANRGHRENETP